MVLANTPPDGWSSKTPPTGWYLYRLGDGGPIRAAARQYWPASTVCEVWNPKTPVWTSRDILEQLSDELDWEDSTQEEVEAWIASVGGKSSD